MISCILIQNHKKCLTVWIYSYEYLKKTCYGFTIYTLWVVLVVEQCKQNIYTYLFIYFSKINPFVKGIFVCIATFFKFLIFLFFTGDIILASNCCVIRILQLLVFTNSAKTITISPCCCESTWNGSNKTGTAGLRPLLRKKQKCQDRLRANERGGRSDGTKRKEIKAEQEEANVVETGRGKKAWQWWNRDVKESKMTALRERYRAKRHENTT